MEAPSLMCNILFFKTNILKIVYHFKKVCFKKWWLFMLFSHFQPFVTQWTWIIPQWLHLWVLINTCLWIQWSYQISLSLASPPPPVFFQFSKALGSSPVALNNVPKIFKLHCSAFSEQLGFTFSSIELTVLAAQDILNNFLQKHKVEISCFC